MNIINFEFKAKVADVSVYENKLLTLNPKFIGTDNQIDTYFNATKGRLKLREGNIENSLIHYDRTNVASSKQSNIILYKHQPDSALKQILLLQLGVKIVIDKVRKIYFIDNVKFHFDTVKTLGTFIEVEAIDNQGSFAIADLKQQCNYYFKFFDLKTSQLIDKSYSDLMLDLG
jgi:adenylate cyclase, class 2